MKLNTCWSDSLFKFLNFWKEGKEIKDESLGLRYENQAVIPQSIPLFLPVVKGKSNSSTLDFCYGHRLFRQIPCSTWRKYFFPYSIVMSMYFFLILSKYKNSVESWS